MSPDKLVECALAAADASYAPYTAAYAGVAIQTRTGALYVGRYAENAAFNPSLSVIGSALAAWMLAAGPSDEITEAACVEHRPGLAQARTAELVLATLSNAPLRSYSAA